MNYQSKIRMSVGWIYPIGIFTSYILAIIEIVIRSYLLNNSSGVIQIPYFTFYAVSLFFIVLGGYQYYRYENWIYPVLGFLIGITTFQGSFIFPHSHAIMLIKATYFISFISIILFIIINWQTIYSHERFEINSRRLFRLAAERIYETSNGYTERPFSAGKIQANKDELLGFVRILHGYYVIRPFYYDNFISLAFSMNKSLLVIKEASEVSHVQLYYDGTITVKISEKDYKDYKERLSFDQLCNSMANVFARFLDYYQKGLEPRIVTELKSAK